MPAQAKRMDFDEEGPISTSRLASYLSSGDVTSLSQFLHVHKGNLVIFDPKGFKKDLIH